MSYAAIQLLHDAPTLVATYEHHLLTLQAQLETRILIIRSQNPDLEELAFLESWISQSYAWLMTNQDTYNKAKLLMGVPQERIAEILAQLEELQCDPTNIGLAPQN